MPFPSPQILSSFVDHYLIRKQPDWDSTVEKIKWFFTRSPFSIYEGETEKKKTCLQLKELFNASDKSEIEKWMNVCIALGNEASRTFKNNNGSLLARYCHAMRTYILACISQDDTKEQLMEHIQSLKSKLYSEPKAAVAEGDKILLDLAYLGDAESVLIAKHLLSMYDFPANPGQSNTLPSYFQNNYHSTKFFNDDIKSCSKLVSFESFESSLAIKTAVNEHKEESAQQLVINEPKVEQSTTPKSVESKPSVDVTASAETESRACPEERPADPVDPITEYSRSLKSPKEQREEMSPVVTTASPAKAGIFRALYSSAAASNTNMNAPFRSKASFKPLRKPKVSFGEKEQENFYKNRLRQRP